MSNEIHQKYPASVQHGKPRLDSLKDGWNRVSIGDLVKEVSRPVEMKDDEIYTLVTAKRSRGGIVKREDLKGRDIAVKNQFYVREGDFLISKRQIVHGACGFVPRELNGAIVSNEYLVLNFTDKINAKFWEFLSHTIYFQQVCFHSSIGVHVEKMLFKVAKWYQWEINIPSPKEQEKIAGFLGAVDARLTQLRRKRDRLQTYKRGVMQKVFSQQIRFRGAIGLNFPDWERKKLQEITKINQGLQIAISDRFTYQVEGSYFYITNEFLKPNSQTHYYILNPPKRALCDKDDILMTRTGNTGQVVTDVVGAFHNNFFKISYDRNKINKKFLLEFLRRDITQHKILSLAGTSTIPDLNHDDFYNLEIFSPVLVEQEKIANFLTAIDRKIEALSCQIEQAEQFKKGLLQKLFV